MDRKAAKVLAMRLREALLSEAWRSLIILSGGSRRALDGRARKEEGSGSSALSSAESKKASASAASEVGASSGAFRNSVR